VTARILKGHCGDRDKRLIEVDVRAFMRAIEAALILTADA
jgi:hypothetical protein